MSLAILPDWNSLDSVRSAHSLLEGGALIFFAALVVCDVLSHVYKDKRESVAKLFERIGLWCFAVAILGEIAAYPYSRRNDFLSDQQNAAQRREIAVLENSTQQLKTDAETAHKQAEDEATARAKIEARVAWRRLTKRQQEEIGSSLGHRFSNQGISLWYNAGDIEGSWFAADIADALRSAQTLRVYPPGSFLSVQEGGRLGEPVRREQTGVIVQSTKDDSSRSLADAIIRELTVRGFDAARQTDPPFDPNPISQVWVNVESRPDGPQGEFKLAARRTDATK
jgi:hypothetical protein